ncbi:MAG TPA: hypothetical protein VMU59_13355 [Caulobacteraceae bacterium]|nr:hypothetical protein [Caulobacteraceae bacterium]
MSDRLIEPSLFVPRALVRSLARVLAAVSRSVEAVDAELLDDALEADEDVALEPAWTEVKADNVSEPKRYEPLLEGDGPGGGLGGGPCPSPAEFAAWEESAEEVADALAALLWASNCCRR